MQKRVKYPLTDEAKEAARYLVKCWKDKKIPQEFSIFRVRGDDYGFVQSDKMSDDF